jgi:hypothetical protein
MEPERKGVMRHSLAVGLGLLAVALAGCLTGETQRSSSHYPSESALNGSTGDDFVELFVAVVERPVGDRYLNGEVWQLADEQRIAPLEGADPELRRKHALEDNGFRVGQIGGLLPPRLQTLVESGRSCAEPRRIRIKVGTATPVELGPVHPSLTVHPVGESEGRQDIDLTRAQCQLMVTPVLQGEDQIRLLFAPVVRHGNADLAPRPLQDPDGTRRWEMQTRQALETWDWLNWSLTLAADEVAMVGARPGQADTLGCRFFLQTEGQTPAQRLLVLRATRCPADHISEETVRHSASAALRAVQPRVGGFEP